MQRGYVQLLLMMIMCACLLLALPAPAARADTTEALAGFISEGMVPDRLPPSGTPLELAVLRGETLPAEAFVTDIVDFSDVTVYFSPQPDFDVPGLHPVYLQLVDTAGNMSRLTASLAVMDGTTKLVVEAGTHPGSITIDSFVSAPPEAGAKLLMDVYQLDLCAHGAQYSIPLQVYGRDVECTLYVQDTQPPTAAPLALELWSVETAQPQDFVADIVDATGVTVEFVSPPDFTRLGTQQVELLLTDAGGNTTTVISSLTVRQDYQPPTISGLQNQNILLGEKANYRKGVELADNSGAEVALEIDSSEVNLNAAGSYRVYYTATDPTGNQTKRSARITVLPVDEDSVYAMADEILAGILLEGMTQEEQAQAIYSWIKTHVRYVSTGDKTGLLQGGYYAFKLRRGDCYTFYAAAEILLTRAGIQNIGVQRVAGSRTAHYWSLVNIGNGWYHFDTCPAPVSIDGFMFSESQAQKYTQSFGASRQYYVYDAEQYPEVEWE